jgi:DNA-binding phage protein
MVQFPAGSRELEKMLNAAFETNNLQSICQAIDCATLQSGGVTEIARRAQIDRVTLYRGLRLEKGFALGNMIKVLRVLGFELIVQPVCGPLIENKENVDSKKGGGTRTGAATARRFTAAFKAEDMNALMNVFRETLLAQENVTQFAGKTNRTREALYRVFTHNPMPRFSTLLSFLNALELHFAVSRIKRSAAHGQKDAPE